MYDPEEKLEVPESFQFPFTPYQIQRDLMSSLFQVIENKKIGIFESPTGTGKSLSLTCGALTWLKQHELLLRQELKARIAQLQMAAVDIKPSSAGDWISEEYEKLQKKDSLNHLKILATKIEQHEQKIKEIRRQYIEGQKTRTSSRFPTKKNETAEVFEKPLAELEDDEFNLKEPDEEDDNDLFGDKIEKDKFQDVKIFFSSRTHSQLSQVVNEIKNTVFSSNTRLISLASRQVFCINPEVNTLKSSALLNERCLELQKSKGKVTALSNDQTAIKRQKTSQKCPFMNQASLERLKNQSLCEIMDIEELVTVSKSHAKGCAYYSSRLAVADAQVVMVPYQILLHKKTREQFGIDLQGAVVIIDEAHNLLDTISSIHSAELTLEMLQAGKEQLRRYKQKYLSRFAARNVLKLNQLIFVVTRLLKMCADATESSRMLFNHELITEGDFFNINLDEILKFCEITCLADKVHGFAQKFVGEHEERVNPKTAETGLKSLLRQMESQNKPKIPEIVRTASTPLVPKPVPNALRPLVTFLKCLTENYDDGRILVTKTTSIKYLLLNPGARFNDIITECRSLILAGGTMKPTDEITQQLFPNCPERVEIHSFDHIVGGDAILPIVVSKGPGGLPFVFNYANRGNVSALQELASTLVNVCRVVPAGVVCFFSSYDYLDVFHKSIEASGALKRLESIKVVFRETRNSNQSDNILTEYSRRINELKKLKSGTTQTGAVLLSVVGGKLSEGLNFSDDLGRCVVVVGLPFPNKTSPELNEKIKYLNRNLSVNAGNEYYENLCMKAVNQCIGRAVRHINDYASVLLIDSRYAQLNIQQKLPKWIAQNVRQPNSYGQVQGLLAKFFKSK